MVSQSKRILAILRPVAALITIVGAAGALLHGLDSDRDLLSAGRPNLAVEIRVRHEESPFADEAHARSGDVLLYRLQVKNNGNAPADQVSISLRLRPHEATQLLEESCRIATGVSVLRSPPGSCDTTTLSTGSFIFGRLHHGNEVGIEFSGQVGYIATGIATAKAVVDSIETQPVDDVAQVFIIE